MTAIPLDNPEALAEYVRDRFEVDMKPEIAQRIVEKVPDGYIGNDCPCCQLVWIMNRLREYRLLSPPHNDPSEIRLFALLHFWPWDDSIAKPPDKYEFDPFERGADVKRSPLSKLREREPIDRVARRIAGTDSKGCPYCKRWFVNSNALALHLAESHEDALAQSVRRRS